MSAQTLDLYDQHAHARIVDEEVYPGRSDFARDRARVLHSAALRRLAAKTQVLMAGQDDFPRTRLTHTLEVAQISRELGAAFGADPDVVDAAGLAHDLGHPPFGHNGEAMLDAIAAEIGGFEGNAQSLRVLTRLESKVFDGQRCVGLNLTRATLDAVIKYPWLRRGDEPKYNAYREDAAAFDWIRQGAPGDTRCFEAQVMDISDDIAYCVHDLEDAIVSESLAPSVLSDPQARHDVVDAAMQYYAYGLEEGQVADALTTVVGEPFWPHGFDHSARASAALKNMTSSLIRRFCSRIQAATWEVYGHRPLARYAADLQIPDSTRAEIAALKAISFVHVMQGNEQRYAWEQTVIGDVVHGLLSGQHRLQPAFQNAMDSTEDSATRLRIVIDQVASLTDLSIIRWRDEMSAA